MIETKIKLWRTAGVAAILSLAACSPAPSDAPADPAAPPAAGGEAGEAAIGEGGGEHGEAGVATAYAGLTGDARTALRLQHLKGFVLVAQQVAEANAPDEAAVLVSQGVLEVYDPATDQFGALNAAPVQAAGNAVGETRQQVAAKLQAANAALDAARQGLSFNHADTAARMVDLSAGLYSHVIQPDFVDPVEYQHSLGAALSARDALVSGRDALRRQNAAAYDEALAELNAFVALWPATTAPERPTAYQDVLRQSSRIRLALSPFLDSTE